MFLASQLDTCQAHLGQLEQQHQKLEQENTLLQTDRQKCEQALVGLLEQNAELQAKLACCIAVDLPLSRRKPAQGRCVADSEGRRAFIDQPIMDGEALEIPEKGQGLDER